MSSATEGRLYSSNGDFIFYKSRTPKDNTKPGIIYCSGYQSKLDEAKAEYLDLYCETNGLGYVRFDYNGHELSSGTILDATLSLWKQNLLDVLDKLTQGPQILVGASIGGWVSFLGALERPERIHSLVGIANSSDGIYLRYLELTEKERETLQKVGYLKEPIGDGIILSHDFFLDSKQHVLVTNERPININCPVRLIHGMKDRVMPYKFSMKIAKKLASNDVMVHLVKNGDHKMSTENDLKLLGNVLDELLSISVLPFSLSKL